jgi:uncharacterized membrane protein
VPLLAVGAGLAFFDIESIMGSGPTMLGFGLAFLILSRPTVLPRFRWLAWVCLFFPVAVFLLIFFFSWSPSEAQTPVSILIAIVATTIAIPLVVTLAAYQKQSGDEDQQKHLLAAEMSADANDHLPGDPLRNLSTEPPNPFTTANEPFATREEHWHTKPDRTDTDLAKPDQSGPYSW